jgi:hypothetical protein
MRAAARRVLRSLFDVLLSLALLTALIIIARRMPAR